MTPQEFTRDYPQFAPKPIAHIAYILSIAEISCPVQKWGTLQPVAIALFTAHTLTAHYAQLAVVASTAGTVDAGNQVNFPSVPGNAMDNDAFLALTVYGLQLKQLKGQLAELAQLGQLGEEVIGHYETIVGNTGFAF